MMRGPARCRPLFWLLCAVLTARLEAQPFTPISPHNLPTVFPGSSAWADFDADGDMDALLADLVDTNTEETRLFRNNGGGSFTLMALPPTRHSYDAYNTHWNDNNGDGELDMLITASDEASRPVMRLFQQETNHLFVDTWVRLPGKPEVWADLDSDGDLDILASATTAQGTNCLIYWKQTRTNYTQTAPGFGAVVSAAAIDIDSDGDLDLFVRTSLSGPAKLFRNDGPGQFTDTGVSLSPRAGFRTGWVDADGDGDLDLLSTGQGANGIPVPKLYRNEGSLRFVDANPELPAFETGTLRWADFDQDGDADVLINGAPPKVANQLYDPRVRIFFNDGTGRYTQGNFPQLPTFEGGEAEVMDFEGDGDVDFMISGAEFSTENPYTRRLYRNGHTPPGNNPLAPIDLSSAVVGNRSILHWNAPTGNAAGLTFNLRVGSQPGGSDVICPLATPDGRRLVSVIGNAQMSRRWYIIGLAPGTYYWTVQSLDQSYRGSPFTAEASFIVPTPPSPLPPPTISELPHQFTDEDVPPSPVNFTISPASSLPNLDVTVAASNPTLCPANGIVITGDGTNRFLSITPGTNQPGTSLMAVRVTDAAGQSASSSFLLNVNPVNDPPSLDPITSQNMYENSSLSVPFRVSDAETQTFALTITTTSSNPTLIASNGLRVVVSRLDGSSYVQVTPQTNRTGFAVMTLSVSDGAVQTATAFILTVLPRPFVATADRLTNFFYGTSAWADYDRDGDLDLLLTGSQASFNGSSRFYRNNGTGSLVDSGLSITGPVLTFPSVADYDRDGDVDGFFLGYPSAQFLRNEGGSNFTGTVNATMSNDDSAVAWGDVDNDGDPDLIVSGSQRGIRVLLNNNGTFGVSQTWPSTAYTGVGDYDGDGWLDLGFSGTFFGTNALGILRGRAGGRYPATDIVLGPSAPGPVGWADVDADGRLDLWHLEFLATTRALAMYRNLGTGQLSGPITIPISFANPDSLRWADFDGDGDLDFIIEVAHSDPTFPGAVLKGFAFYRNDGEFQFTRLGDLLPISGSQFFAIGDFDNDGDVDVSGVYSGSLCVLTNRISQLNPPPPAPSGLGAGVQGSSVSLNWRPVTDFNQRTSLTYNVRVGTRPGAADVLPSMSLTNGFRMVVGFGNAWLRTNLFLTNLVGETFYWSVQAVDNCYKGGPFAPEQSFIINLPGNQPPVIGEIADQEINEDSVVVVPFTLSDARTPFDNIRLRALPADPFLIPVGNIRFGGSGTNRTLTLTPATNQVGQTTITVEATDAVGSSAARTFSVVVSNLNDAPFISAIPTQTNLYSAEPWLVQFTISDPETPADQLQLTGLSSNPAAVPSTNIVFSGTGANRTATIRSVAPVEGATTITISVSDPEGATNSRSFLLVLGNERFRLLTTPFGGVRFGSIAWGDYDNDGDLDLALAGDGVNQTALYRNEGGGVFVKAATELPNGGNIEWVDFDNDGDLDLAIPYGTSGPIFVVSLYRNLGNGQFAFLNNLPGRNDMVGWGDYDNDGKPDVVITGEIYDASGYQSIVYHNDGGGVFRMVTAIPNSIADYWLTTSGIGPWLDANGDGNLDLVLQSSGGVNATNLLFLGNGQGGFSNTPAPWTGSAVAWADFDNDGRPDILESTGTRQNLRVLGNLGNGSFTPWGANIQTNWTPDSVAVGDFNNDGFPDLLSSGYEGSFNYQTRLFQSQGTGAWSRASIPMLDFKFATASWADIDNDGDVDLLINGQRDQQPLYGHSTLLYRNEQPRTNSPPSAPAGLQASFTSNSVFLSWQPASDAEQTNGLTYNVRIGTTPGGFDVLSPMSATNGYRLVAKNGNAGWQMRKVMKGMQSGRRYYWSVQAVDNSYKGSAFAIESSFFLGQVPSLADVPDQTMDEDGALGVPLVVADPDGDANVVIVNAVATNSALVPSTNLVVSGSGANRLILITPAPDQNGSTRIELTVTDEQGGLTTRSFTLTVLPVNDPPRAQNRHYTLAEDTNLDFVLSADDPEGDALTYGIETFPWYGMLSGTGSQFRYSPRRDFFGDDQCEFVVSDNHGASNVFQVTFEITPVADVPGARVSIRLLSDGTPFMSLRGEPYQFYVIETSTDLWNWTAVGTYLASGGLIEFIGVPAPAGTGRFYRARLP